MSINFIEEFSRGIAKRTSSESIFLYWKGRVGLYALLKAMEIEAGDEIILPAYTCVVVPNAILYLNAKPVYVDVTADSYNMDFSLLKHAITDKTKVIICQNTYGLSSNLEEIHNLAKTHGLYTIEDCTHGFGGTYNGIPNAFYCDASFFSTQWNKPFSTGVGGFAITNNKYLTKKLSQLHLELVPSTTKEIWNLKILYFVRRHLINDYTYWPLVHFYRWLSHHTPVVGSSSLQEINSTEMPENYFKGFSTTQAKEGLRNLKSLSHNLVKRKESALLYTTFLKKNNKNYVSTQLFNNHSFLKYPLLVNNRDKFLALAEKNNIELGEWFSSPLHPVKADLSIWKLNVNDFPVSKYLADHVVNLPTTPKKIYKIIDFLKTNLNLIC